MKTRDALRIIDRISHLHHAYLREYSYQVGLNLRQLECLFYFHNCNRYSDTPVALKEYLGLTKGTVSQTVLSLEEKGLLKKSFDSNDGRIVHVALTKRAENIVKDCSLGSPLEKAFSNDPPIAPAVGTMLLSLLTEAQRINKSKTFGACYTCSYFRREGLVTSHQCGLTMEPLSEQDSLKICREHTRG